MGESMTSANKKYPMLYPDERLPFPIELIISGVHSLFKLKCGNRYTNKCPKRNLLLYNLAVLEEGYLPLNRDYKPLGLCFFDKWCEYDNYPFLLIPKENVEVLYLEEINRLAHHYFLFSDLTYPETKSSKKRYANILIKIFEKAYPSIKERLEEVCGTEP